MKAKVRNRVRKRHRVGLAETIARSVARFTASTTAFLLALGTVVVWAALGPVFHYSDTWQLVINTGTTIVTFLMVFLIQNTQNRDGAAIQAKLDELLRATEAARNEFVGLEHLTEEEVEAVRRQCEADAGEAERGMPKALVWSFDRLKRTSRPR